MSSVLLHRVSVSTFTRLSTRGFVVAAAPSLRRDGIKANVDDRGTPRSGAKWAAPVRSIHLAPMLRSDDEKKGEPGLLDPERIVAEPGFNRWLSVPPVLFIQGSIGSIYAWSVFNNPLTRDLGVIAQSAQDWGLSEVVPIFSTTAACFGATVWLGGKYIERIGPRQAAVMAATFWGSGLAVAGIGAGMHSLPMLYAGYGLLGGLGFAFGYISPVANLMRWFPDKKGVATGLGVSFFGGGALLCAPLAEKLFTKFQQLPDHLGDVSAVDVVVEQGKRLVQIGGEMKEVIVASKDMVASFPGVVENGVYVVGTGDTGVSSTFLTLSAMYTAGMMAGAFAQRSPWKGYDPMGTAPAEGETAVAKAPEEYVPLESVMKLPQFYLFWLATCGNAAAGVAIISCAKTIMSDVFSSQLPHVVDGAFAVSYVMGLSLANMGGRLFWASASDKIGRRNVYLTFGAIGLPLCLGIPQLTAAVSVSPEPWHVYAFTAASCGLVTCYGGLLGILPAYISDVFGNKNAPSIFGRAMTGWATAALVAPQLLTRFRQQSYDEAVQDLVEKCDPAAFKAKFGSGVEDIQALIDAKSVTIASMMDIVPAGTIDPTAVIYDSSMYTMAFALGGALAANAALRPVDKKHWVQDK